MVFRGQGEVILDEARSMGDSVGSAHLGFMGQVRDEIKVGYQSVVGTSP